MPLMAELFPQVRQKARQAADAPARAEDVIIVALDDHVAAIRFHMSDYSAKWGRSTRVADAIA